MYVSTINILWSVVYITGYKEKGTAELSMQKNYTHMHLLNLYHNWLTTASGSYKWWRRVNWYSAGGVAKFPRNWYALYYETLKFTMTLSKNNTTQPVTDEVITARRTFGHEWYDSLLFLLVSIKWLLLITNLQIIYHAIITLISHFYSQYFTCGWASNIKFGNRSKIPSNVFMTNLID
jgi:hypothetical protein